LYLRSAVSQEGQEIERNSTATTPLLESAICGRRVGGRGVVARVCVRVKRMVGERPQPHQPGMLAGGGALHQRAQKGWSLRPPAYGRFVKGKGVGGLSVRLECAWVPVGSGPTLWKCPDGSRDIGHI
jgi:hypothetical protein